jgi:hypothetical protein
VTKAIASGGKIDYHRGMGSLYVRRCTPPRSPRLGLAPLAILGLWSWIAGCSSSASAPDAGPDTPSPCPAGELFYTGELVDWGSTAAAFLGVYEASFTVDGEPSRTDKTSPNGRFELCLANAASTLVTVDATAASTYFDGVAVAEADVIKSGLTISMRSFTAMRTMTPPIAFGKAQVFVHVAGAQRAVNLPALSEAKLVFDGTQWKTAGPTDVGSDVFFTNVTAADPPVAVQMSGTFLGGKSVPLWANKLTFVTVVGK